MNKRYVFICEDSLEGIFSGVYTAWEARVGHGNVELRTWEDDNLELFCEYRRVDTDLEKAEKVMKTLKNRKNPWVRKVLELHRNVWNEYHHYLGFLRFRQMKGNILFSSISPKNDVMLLFQEHFGDRFADEFWIIYDDNRGKALVHVPDRPCAIYEGDREYLEQLSKEEDMEKDYEKLFQSFCTSISIKERENPQLQKQNLPYRFRDHMVEFNKI